MTARAPKDAAPYCLAYPANITSARFLCSRGIAAGLPHRVCEALRAVRQVRASTRLAKPALGVELLFARTPKRISTGANEREVFVRLVVHDS